MRVMILKRMVIGFSHLFLSAILKGTSFFPVGDPVQSPPQNPVPGLASSTKRSSSRVQEREGFGVENCLTGGGVDRGEKRKKDTQKKVGLVETKFDASVTILKKSISESRKLP